MLENLRSLVATNELLKKQEQDFRNHCKEELAKLKSQIAELKASSEEGSSEDNVCIYHFISCNILFLKNNFILFLCFIFIVIALVQLFEVFFVH